MQLACFTVGNLIASKFGFGIGFAAADVFVVTRADGVAVDAAAGFETDMVERDFDGRYDFVAFTVAGKGHGRGQGESVVVSGILQGDGLR